MFWIEVGKEEIFIFDLLELSIVVRVKFYFFGIRIMWLILGFFEILGSRVLVRMICRKGRFFEVEK